MRQPFHPAWPRLLVILHHPHPPPDEQHQADHRGSHMQADEQLIFHTNAIVMVPDVM